MLKLNRLELQPDSHKVKHYGPNLTDQNSPPDLLLRYQYPGWTRCLAAAVHSLLSVLYRSVAVVCQTVAVPHHSALQACLSGPHAPSGLSGPHAPAGLIGKAEDPASSV